MLLNAFPQARDTDPKGLLYAFGIAVEGISTQAIIDTARKFIRGEVATHDRHFAPTPAEFAREARWRQECLDIASRPRIEAPKESEPYSPPVRPEAMQAWRDAIAGLRTIDSVAEEFLGRKAQGE